MIRLTAEQHQAIQTRETVVVDPVTNQTYILVRQDVYQQMKERLDDSDWSDEELEALSVEAGEMLDAFRARP